MFTVSVPPSPVVVEYTSVHCVPLSETCTLYPLAYAASHDSTAVVTVQVPPRSTVIQALLSLLWSLDQREALLPSMALPATRVPSW